MRELDWVLDQKIPTLEEYLVNGTITCGAEIYFINFFLLSPGLSPQVLESEEYKSLFSLSGRLSRLFNDTGSVEVII